MVFFYENLFSQAEFCRAASKLPTPIQKSPPGSGQSPAVRLWKRGQGREERISPAATTAGLIFQRVGHREDAASPDPCAMPLTSETREASEAVQVTKTYDSERTASQGPAPRWSRARPTRRRHDGGGEPTTGHRTKNTSRLAAKLRLTFRGRPGRAICRMCDGMPVVVPSLRGTCALRGFAWFRRLVKLRLALRLRCPCVVEVVSLHNSKTA